MYVYFEHSPGKWLVGHYDTSGTWKVESEHNSRSEANSRVVRLNRLSPAYLYGGRVNLTELIEYLDSECRKCEDKRNLSRVLNVLKLLSNFFLYADHISQSDFFGVNNTGKKTWEVYLKVLDDFKNRSSSVKQPTISSGKDRFSEMIWRQVL